jgi:hypothetical protein
VSIVTLALPGGTPAAVAQRGRLSGIVLLIKPEEGGVDDFIFVDEGGSCEGLALEPMVIAVPD